MKKIHYILLIILVLVGIIRVVYEYRAHKEEITILARYESRQKEVMKKGAPQAEFAANIAEMEKIFNKNLPSCTPVNVVLEDKTDNYVIFGKDGAKCSFEKYTPIMSIQCLVPQDVAEKYSLAWNGIDSYINEVNNNKTYCKMVTSDKNKLVKKKNKEKH